MRPGKSLPWYTAVLTLKKIKVDPLLHKWSSKKEEPASKCRIRPRNKVAIHTKGALNIRTTLRQYYNYIDSGSSGVITESRNFVSMANFSEEETQKTHTWFQQVQLSLRLQYILSNTNTL